MGNFWVRLSTNEEIFSYTGLADSKLFGSSIHLYACIIEVSVDNVETLILGRLLPT